MRTDVKRITAAYTLTREDHVIHAQTDGGAFPITMPAGGTLRQGDTFKVANVGTSGNDVTWTSDDNADPTEDILGAPSQSLADGESIEVHYNPTEGWA